jgi:hypothetical protein
VVSGSIPVAELLIAHGGTLFPGALDESGGRISPVQLFLRCLHAEDHSTALSGAKFWLHCVDVERLLHLKITAVRAYDLALESSAK